MYAVFIFNAKPTSLRKPIPQNGVKVETSVFHNGNLVTSEGKTPWKMEM
jgi:hypothetical protein